MAEHLILTLAVITTGLGAGVFTAYAVAVMPGLADTDDRTFVAAFAAIDRAIARPPFLVGVFLGSPVLLLLTCLTGADERPAPAWTAFALSVVAVVVTLVVNVPLNDALKAAADRAGADAGEVRAAFHETRWMVANALRAVLSTCALALVFLAGRS